MFISKELLQLNAGKFNIDLSEEQIQKFDRYAAVLTEYNKKVNLTAIKTPDDIVIKHFADSMAPLSFIDITENSSFADIGSGAGFPGMVFAVLRKDLKIILVESIGKKADFLKYIIKELNLRAKTLNVRSEEMGKEKNYRESFDYVAARAVAPLNILSELCLPLVKKDGTFIAYKGSEGRNEIYEAEKAVEFLGGEVKNIFDYDKRTLIEIKKISQTSAKYPRNIGKIKNNPL